jgi:lysylphosphatidylglycerol synthetase-like protein (DUF2156 family)
MTPLSRLLTRASTALLGMTSFVHGVSAQVFDGPGILGGLDIIGGVAGLPSGDVRTTIIRILLLVLSFLALAAVITIIIAGIILILSLGNEESKDRAKRIIFYTLIGLAIVLFARVIVGIITVYLAGQL